MPEKENITAQPESAAKPPKGGGRTGPIVTSAVSAFAGALLAILALGTKPATMVVDGIDVRDAHGVTRASVDVNDGGGVALTLFDPEGVARVEVACAGDGTGTVSLNRAPETPGAVLSADSEKTAFVAFDNTGAPVTLLGVSARGPELQLRGSDRSELIAIGATSEGWIKP